MASPAITCGTIGAAWLSLIVVPTRLFAVGGGLFDVGDPRAARGGGRSA